MDELVSAGTLGLIDAAEHFDAARGLAFSTFASPRIRGAMLDELRRQDTASRSVRRKSRAMSLAIDSLRCSLGREPESAEIARSLGVDVDTLWRWQAHEDAARPVRIDALVPAGDAARESLHSLLGAQESEIDERLTREQEVALVRDALLELPEQERTVLSLYYFEELRLTDIARVLGVTESRVSQIRGKAIGKLRASLATLRESAA
jgi:RNA polymerase sigma factor for flagellar operon FliA